MKALNLRDALKLYGIMYPFLPIENDINKDSTKFIGKIIENMIEQGQHGRYLDAISLMWNIPVDELLQKDQSTIVQLLVDGLMINKFADLLEFCVEAKYNART